MLADVAFGWRRTARRTLELVEQIQPDLVHLNAMVLSPSADALIQAGRPFVWHVREPAPDNGFRTRMIRRVMLRATHLIFISEFDKHSWIQDQNGVVIPNFVDLTRFSPDADGQSLREMLQMSPDAKVILYLGDVSAIKGFYVLLDALCLLKQRNFQFVCLMPGAVLGRAQSTLGRIARVILPLVGSGTPKQQAKQRIMRYRLEANLRLLPFATDIVPYFAASDVIVFPATKPHFARPVIESIAMHKPAVGSDIGGVRELLAIHPLGRATPVGDAIALSDAIEELTSDRARSADLDAQFTKVKARFDLQHGVHAIAAIYHEIMELNHKCSQEKTAL